MKILKNVIIQMRIICTEIILLRLVVQKQWIYNDHIVLTFFIDTLSL